MAKIININAIAICSNGDRLKCDRPVLAFIDDDEMMTISEIRFEPTRETVAITHIRVWNDDYSVVRDIPINP